MYNPSFFLNGAVNWRVSFSKVNAAKTNAVVDSDADAIQVTLNGSDIQGINDLVASLQNTTDPVQLSGLSTLKTEKLPIVFTMRYEECYQVFAWAGRNKDLCQASDVLAHSFFIAVREYCGERSVLNNYVSPSLKADVHNDSGSLISLR